MYNLSSHEGQILVNDKYCLFQTDNTPGSYVFDLSKLVVKSKGFGSSKRKKANIRFVNKTDKEYLIENGKET